MEYDVIVAERNLIGLALKDTKNIVAARDRVHDSHFMSPIRREIWSSLMEHEYEAGDGDGLIVAVESVCAKTSFTKKELTTEIYECMDNTFSGLGPDHWIPVLSNQALRGDVLRVSNELGAVARATSSFNMIDKVESILGDLISKHSPPAQIMKFGDVLSEILAPGKGSQMRLLNTWIVDKLMGGIEKDSMTVIGGRPSEGKTTFALHVIRRFVKAGGTAGFISLEMNTHAIGKIICAAETQTDYKWWRTSMNFPSHTKEKIKEGMKEIDRYRNQLQICEPKSFSLPVIESTFNRMVMNGARMIVIDYLQLIEVAKVQTRYQQLSLITRRLKNLAREYSVPVILLSQLSRSNIKDKRKPSISDLRDSGSIEQDADNVLLLYSPPPQNEISVRVNEITVAKNRNGPTGKKSYSWNTSQRRFHEPDLYSLTEA